MICLSKKIGRGDARASILGSKAVRVNVNLEIDIPESFHAHVDAAIMRLRYLHPSWEMSEASGKVKITNVPSSDVPAAPS